MMNSSSNNNLKVSIIAAAYNEERNIKNFLAFWLNQTYQNLEIIIVDDGSKDNTVTLIKTEQKNNPKLTLIENKINKGIGYSRYMGFLAATGEIIKFSDTDIANDYPLDPTFLERLIKPFAENDDVDVVYIDYTPLIDEKNILRTMENIFYYSRVAKTPQNYQTRTTPAGHMPTIFRNKKIDLAVLPDIKNGEDRYIANEFLKKSRKRAQAEGIYCADACLKTFTELKKRYFSYGKNSLDIWQVNKLIFLKHLTKPFAVITAIILFLIGLIDFVFCQQINYLLLTLPFVALLLLFEIITLVYSLPYLKTIELLIKAVLFGPLIVFARYFYTFLGMTQIFKKLA